MMTKKSYQAGATVKIYHGYGHQDNLVLYGHVLGGSPPKAVIGNGLLSNITHLIKIFSVKPIAGVRVRLQWQAQSFYTTTAKDGFFKFEWKSTLKISAGWHVVLVDLINSEDKVLTTGEGKIFVPESTQYGFISDIDDTVLVSHSASTGKKLRVMFTKNPLSRKTFADVVKFYKLLSLAHTEPSLLNPFFYVSSSEWNLYDDLNVFFKHNQLPKGVFLLNEIKRWYQLLKTGRTKHQGKLIRVARIFEAFPKQRFVLLGDNSQKDPVIYAGIANKYPDRVVAIYIRNVSPQKAGKTVSLMKSIDNKAIYTCQFEHTDEAISHAKSIGLIV